MVEHASFELLPRQDNGTGFCFVERVAFQARLERVVRFTPRRD
jgi:hypothetical protein